jgi:hypothetical protein
MALGEKWRVGLREPLWLVRRGFAGRAEGFLAGAEALSPAQAAAQVSTWFPSGYGADERSLAELALGLEGAFPGSGVPERGFLLEVVRRALHEGRLVALRAPVGGPGEGFADEVEEEPPTPRREARVETTWIEIALVDEADPPEPVPFGRYAIELPGGEVRTGMLDARGRARVDGIDPGKCIITFPDLDAEAWRRARA